MQPHQLRKLKRVLIQGGIIAYPSETLWGLGCLPRDERALQKLALIKQRPLHKGFILIASDIAYCLEYIHPDFHQMARHKVICNLQQPTTWLVPKSNRTPPLLTGNFPNIAIRISPHPFIRQLCDSIKTAVVSTSANLNRHPSLNSALLIEHNFKRQLAYIVKGYESGNGTASRIKELQTGATIRP